MTLSALFLSMLLIVFFHLIMGAFELQFVMIGITPPAFTTFVFGPLWPTLFIALLLAATLYIHFLKTVKAYLLVAIFGTCVAGYVIACYWPLYQARKMLPDM